MQRQPLIGTTYSHRHIEELDLNATDAFKELLSLKFDIIRLACYWDEMQPDPQINNFAPIHELLKKCEQENQKVLMTIGMKAPRWPEFYIPHWLAINPTNSFSLWERVREKAIPYLQKVITQLQSYDCITHWQIENEPLDPSGPEKLTIPLDILQEEVQLIKKLDKRPVLINLWANELTRRNLLPHILELADIVGLDIYYKVPSFSCFYIGPSNSDMELAEIINSAQKPFWITELQAEPWEIDEQTKFQGDTPSCNPELLQENFTRASTMKPEATLLWGYEYWYWQKQNKNTALWQSVKKIVNTHK
jgi:hypothetical protein